MTDLPERISRATVRHCAAVFSEHSMNVACAGTKDVRHQGTITFIEWQRRCYGVTNYHVTKHEDRAEDTVFLMALDRHTPIPVRSPDFLENDARKDPTFPFDLSVFPLEDRVVLAGGKEPCVLDSTPRLPQEGENLLAVGFPGQARRMNSPKVEHGAYHVVAPCAGSSNSQITLYSRLPDEKRTLLFGGMSGGPIFRLTDDSYELLGIIDEGAGPNDPERPSGADDLVIRGFPLIAEVLSRFPTSGS